VLSAIGLNRSHRSGEVRRRKTNFEKNPLFSVGILKVGTDVQSRENKRAKAPVLYCIVFIYLLCCIYCIVLCCIYCIVFIYCVVFIVLYCIYLLCCIYCIVLIVFIVLYCIVLLQPAVIP
jgi:fatty acid desaturase